MHCKIQGPEMCNLQYRVHRGLIKVALDRATTFKERGDGLVDVVLIVLQNKHDLIIAGAFDCLTNLQHLNESHVTSLL